MMSEDRFKHLIIDLQEKGELSLDNLIVESTLDGEVLLQYIEGYLNHVFAQRNYEHMTVIIPIFLKAILKLDFIIKYESFLHGLYKELRYRSKNSVREEDDKKIIKRLYLCRKLVKDFIDTFVTDKVSNRDEVKEFEYIWKVLVEIKDVEFYRVLTRRQCYFVNIEDVSNNSLFYRLVREYLDTYDEYLLGVIPVLLENPNFLSKNAEIESIYEDIQERYEEKGASKKEIDRLRKLLDHYFQYKKGELMHRTGLSTSLEKPPKLEIMRPVILDIVDMDGRVDLTELKTFSLSDSLDNKSVYDVSSAYSILEVETGYELYYHIPDLPEYIEVGSKEDLRASHIIEEIHYKNSNILLFDRESLTIRTGFLPELDRLAITFRLKLDHKFRIKSLEVFESVVRNDKVFTESQVSETLKGNTTREVFLLLKIVDALKDENTHYESVAKGINETLFSFLDRSVVYLRNCSLPFTYKNLIGRDNMASVMMYSWLTLYTNKTWGSRTAREFLACYNHRPLEVKLYTPVPIGLSLKGKTFAQVTNPQKSYIALENLRMIKDLVIRRLPTKDEWRERAIHNSFIANAMNERTFLEDEDAKRLLLNGKKCDRIGL